ncbi:MAG: flap endonuclease-1 [Methanobacteriota archaeon]|nr:MAG: flap endonuclease-1 [Euryarchaeota archaeon]
MGVALTPIIEKTVVDLDAFRGRTIAVDGNLELYQFLSVIRLRDGTPLKDEGGRVTSHLNGLMFRTTRLVSDHDIRPVFVFDGVPPSLKAGEIERRRAAREKAAKEYELALKGGDYGTAWSKAVMTSRLTREMVAEAKTLLGLLGIPYVQAPSEGEAQAAWLARQGVAWAVGSKDYDSLLFGAPRVARFLTISGSEFLPSLGRSRPTRPEIIELDPWLRSLSLTREQLIDVAVLVGTDFNEGTKGIGPKKGVKLIREIGSLDNASDEIRRGLPENLQEIREFFLHPPVESNPSIVRGPTDEAAVFEFLCDERGFTRERVRVALERLRPPGFRSPTLDTYP